MAVFRVEKTRNYTVMSNHHLRDKSLSLKAKGLLSLMLSLPEDWDYGVLFYPIVNKVEKTGTVEIMAKAKDAKQINRIFERMGYPAPVQSDARKQRPRAPSENSFKERGSGARTSTEMDKPSVREKVKALKAEVEAVRRREPVIPLKENDLVK